MKKLFLGLFLVVAVSLTSCQGKKDGKATGKETKTETSVPKFDNKKVGEYIKAYDAYIEDYKKIVDSKDMTKFQELGTKGQELAKKAQELTTSGLSASDTKKLNEYMTAKAKELQELSQKMMQ